MLRSSGWFSATALRHGAEEAHGRAVGAHPVVVLTVDPRRVHGRAPVLGSATAPNVQAVRTRLRQGVGVVHTPVAVGPDGRPAVASGGRVDPDANLGVVAVEALNRTRDRATGGRCARSGETHHADTHQQDCGSCGELLLDSRHDNPISSVFVCEQPTQMQIVAKETPYVQMV